MSGSLPRMAWALLLALSSLISRPPTRRIREVLDDGGPGFYDVYEFTPYDANAEFGVEFTFDSPEEALDYAVRNLGADPGRFVGDGGVQFGIQRLLEHGEEVTSSVGVAF